MSGPTDGSYRDRILRILGDRDPVASLEESRSAVERVVGRLGAAGLARSYAPGKWMGLEVLAHLADVELGIGFRIRQVLAEPNHRIQPFDQDAWARAYAEVDPALALRAFLAFRDWNLALLRKLTPDDMQRSAHHPERGEEPLGVVVRHLAGHTLSHLRQLESLDAGAG
jgi:hypothetical protein